MDIDRMHSLLASVSGRFHLDILSDSAVVTAVEKSLTAHGHTADREMPLKARFVFWLVLLLALRRDRSVPNAFGSLVESCRGMVGGLSRKAITDGGLARARQRLGPEPVETVFTHLAGAPRRRPWFYGHRPMAMDGVRLTMPDSPKNLACFPRQKSGRGRSAWPQMLAVCLLEIADRRIVAGAFDRIHGSERALGRRLWRHLGEDDLLVEDKGFFSNLELWELDQAKKHFVCKLPNTVKVRLLHQYGTGDCLVELRGRRPRREYEGVDHPGVGRPSQTKKFKLTVRLLAYSLNGAKHRIVTNVFNREITPHEFAKVYHWRWDAEIAYDELKTHLMTVQHGKAKTVFRSKSPELVEQEFWAMLIAYNLVRGLIVQAATAQDIDPLEISFTESLAVIEDNMISIQNAPVTQLPRLRRRLLRDIAECRIDRPRRPRQWPRVVKLKMSNFRVKQAHHHEEILDVKLQLSAHEWIDA